MDFNEWKKPLPPAKEEEEGEEKSKILIQFIILIRRFPSFYRYVLVYNSRFQNCLLSNAKKERHIYSFYYLKFVSIVDFHHLLLSLHSLGVHLNIPNQKKNKM